MSLKPDIERIFQTTESELMMSRYGMLIFVMNMLFLLPVLPFLAIYYAYHKYQTPPRERASHRMNTSR